MKKELSVGTGDGRTSLFAAENNPAEGEKLMMQERDDLFAGLSSLNMHEGMGFGM